MIVVLALMANVALADRVELESGAVLEARMSAFDRDGDCALTVTEGELAGAMVVVPCAEVVRFQQAPSAVPTLSETEAPALTEIEAGPEALSAAPIEAMEPEAMEAVELEVDAVGAPPVLLVQELPSEEVSAPPALTELVQEPTDAPAAVEEAPEAMAVTPDISDPPPMAPQPLESAAESQKLEPEAATPVRRATLPADVPPPGSTYHLDEPREAEPTAEPPSAEDHATDEPSTPTQRIFRGVALVHPSQWYGDDATADGDSSEE